MIYKDYEIKAEVRVYCEWDVTKDGEPANFERELDRPVTKEDVTLYIARKLDSSDFFEDKDFATVKNHIEFQETK